MRTTYDAPRIRFDWRGYFTPAVRLLIIANAAVFLGQLLAQLIGGKPTTIWINFHLGLVPVGVFPGMRLWQPFTYLFLHGGIGHLVVNMLFLLFFGRELELVWGYKRFLNYYFICGVGAGLITVLVKYVPAIWGSAPSPVPTIGASGAIYGILIANAILFPDRQVFMFPLPIAIPMRSFVALMAAIEFFSTLGAAGDSVSHLCHLGGLLIGWLYLRRGSFLYRVRNEVSDWQYQRNQKRFKVYMKKHRNEPPSDPDRWVN